MGPRHRYLASVSLACILALWKRAPVSVVGPVFAAYLVCWLVRAQRSSSALPSLRGPVVTEQEVHDIADGEKEESSADAERLPGARGDDSSERGSEERGRFD